MNISFYGEILSLSTPTYYTHSRFPICFYSPLDPSLSSKPSEIPSLKSYNMPLLNLYKLLLSYILSLYIFSKYYRTQNIGFFVDQSDVNSSSFLCRFLIELYYTFLYDSWNLYPFYTPVYIFYLYKFVLNSSFFRHLEFCTRSLSGWKVLLSTYKYDKACLRSLVVFQGGGARETVCPLKMKAIIYVVFLLWWNIFIYYLNLKYWKTQCTFRVKEIKYNGLE